MQTTFAAAHQRANELGWYDAAADDPGASET
jgi:hypothetical protein